MRLTQTGEHLAGVTEWRQQDWSGGIDGRTVNRERRRRRWERRRWPPFDVKIVVAIGPSWIDHRVGAFRHRIRLGSSWRRRLCLLQSGDGLAQIRHSTLQIGAPSEEIV